MKRRDVTDAGRKNRRDGTDAGCKNSRDGDEEKCHGHGVLDPFIKHTAHVREECHTTDSPRRWSDP